MLLLTFEKAKFYTNILLLENCAKCCLDPETEPEPEPKLFPNSEPEPQQIITVPQHCF